MINLIPSETKRQLRAARMNSVLLNYCILLLLAALSIASVFGVGFWLTFNEHQSADASRQQGEQAAAAYATTRQVAESFKNDLKQAKTILGSQVSMYNLITRIAALVPPGVILSNLSLDTNATSTTPLAISAKAKNYDGIIRLKNNLITSHVFDSVSIINTTNSPVDPRQDPVGAAYPIAANLSAQLSKQTPQAAPVTGVKP